MKTTAAFASFALALGLAAVACTATDSDAPPAGATPGDGARDPDAADDAIAPLPTSDGASDAPSATPEGGPSGFGSLGSVSNVVPGSGGQPCAPGATCKTMTVSCSGMPDLQAIVALREPSGAAKGTIFVHGGGGGDAFYNTNVSEFVNAGFRVAQVRWASDWEITPNQGIKAGACRPSTAMKWVFDEIHKGDRTTGFCASGHSGGSAVIGYALAHYGAEAFLDYAALLSGPPFARLDYGCAPSTYSGPPPALCPELPNAPIALPAKVDPWDNTTTCAQATSSAADIAHWKANSIVSGGADYDYPKTPVDFFDCATNPNGTAGGAYFYSHEIQSTHAVHCATDCNQEALGPTSISDQLAAMIASCKPHH